MSKKSPFFYETDTGLYFHTLIKRSYSKKSAVSVLTEMDWLTSEAEEHLQAIKKLGASRDEIKKSQGLAKTSDLDFQEIYDNLQPFFLFKFYINETGSKTVYLEGPNKSLKKLSMSETTIYDVLRTTPTFLEFKDYYNGLSKIQKKNVSFTKFVHKLIDEYLEADETNLLDKEPPILSWDADEYALNKIQFTSIVEGPTPAWDEFICRLDYPELFMAWIWSIIEPTNTVRQLLWIKGKGQDGKSVVQKALSTFLGNNAVHSMRESDLDNTRFLMGSAQGKILITYPDCSHPFLLRNESIKQITGGDRTSIEEKGKQATSGVVQAKIFATGNGDPKVNPQSKFQVSRLLKLNLKETHERTNDFEHRLVSEMYHFLFKCRAMFEKHVEKGLDNIHIPPDILQKMLSNCSSDSYLIAKNFEDMYIEYGSDFECTLNDYNRALGQYEEESCCTKQTFGYVKSEFSEMLKTRNIELQESKSNSMICFVGFRIKEEKLKTIRGN